MKLASNSGVILGCQGWSRYHLYANFRRQYSTGDSCSKNQARRLPPDTHTKMFLHAPFHPCGEKIKKSREEPLRRHCSQEKSSYPSRIHNSTWVAENHHLESLNRWTLRRSRTPGIVLFPTIASLKGQSGRCQWFRLNDSNLLHFELSKELSTKRSSRSKSQIKVNSHSVT